MRYLIQLAIVTGWAVLSGQCLAQAVNGTIWINDGEPVTKDKEGKVLVRVEANNADKMMISVTPDFAGAKWEDYRMLVRAVKLTGGDGEKTVYARFKDIRGNISSVTSADIELDRQPPVGIGAEAKRAESGALAVDLTLKANGAHKMRISNRPDFLGAYWVPFQASYPGWPVSGSDGEKVIYIQFEDKVGNKSKSVSAKTVFDLTPPQLPGLLINEGATFVTSGTANIDLAAYGASQMKTSIKQQWEPFQEHVEWDLSDKQDGEHVFRAKFKDAVGNETEWIEKKVILDRSAPTLPSISVNGDATYASANDVSLELFANGAEEMLVSNDPYFAGAKWMLYQRHFYNWKLPQKDGTMTVYAKFRDVAGNETDAVFSSIELDISAPRGAAIHVESDKIIVEKATEGKYLADPLAPVQLTISGNGADEMLISSHKNFKDASWQPFAESLAWKIKDPQDGPHYIYLKLRDKAGHTTRPVVDNFFIDTHPPINCSIEIEQGAEYCTNRDHKTALKMRAKEAFEMKIFNEGDVESARWQKYQQQAIWKLSDSEGEKRVGIIFKDFVGNESQPVYGSILLDNTPPTGGQVSINRGDDVSNDPDKKVTVNVQATDAVLMQVSNDPSFSGIRWQAFTQDNIGHVLAGDDGTKKVYVRFVDNAGNISKIISDEIILDRTPPTECSVTINGGKQTTNNSDNLVQLALHAKDASEMRINNSPVFGNTPWEQYSNAKTWELTKNDGQKAVYVQYRDEVGNMSKIAYDKIGLDTEAPKNGSISINNDAPYCTDLNSKVLLSLHAHEATQMMISESSSFSDAQWETFKILIQDHELSSGDGTKTVYAKFKDDAGNETEPVSTSTILDTKQPSVHQVVTDHGEIYTSRLDRMISVEMKVEGAEEMIFSNDKNFKPPYKWEAFVEKKDWKLTTGDGPKKFYTKFRDQAGNESLEHENMIILDTQDPVIRKVVINSGKTETKETQVTVYIEAVDAYEMKVSNDRTLSDAEWKPYLSSFKWSLKPGEGGRFVYVKLKDRAGNESTMVSAFITLHPISI